MDKWRQSSVRNDRVYKLTDHVTSVISKNGYVMIEGGETDQLFPGDRNIVFLNQSIEFCIALLREPYSEAIPTQARSILSDQTPAVQVFTISLPSSLHDYGSSFHKKVGTYKKLNFRNCGLQISAII